MINCLPHIHTNGIGKRTAPNDQGSIDHFLPYNPLNGLGFASFFGIHIWTVV